jgi:hypothetical protein
MGLICRVTYGETELQICEPNTCSLQRRAEMNGDVPGMSDYEIVMNKRG